MIRKYIIVADDSLKGCDEAIEKLEREWGAEEIEPCEDCISREEVMKLLEKEDWADTVYGVMNLPSVTPSRPKGKWIQTKDDCDGVNFYNFSFECSKCGKEQSFKSTFCPICGAYMREVKE